MTFWNIFARLAALEAKVTALTSQSDDLAADVTAIQTAVTNLAAAETALAAEIAALKAANPALDLSALDAAVAQLTPAVAAVSALAPPPSS